MCVKPVDCDSFMQNTHTSRKPAAKMYTDDARRIYAMHALFIQCCDVNSKFGDMKTATVSVINPQLISPRSTVHIILNQSKNLHKINLRE